MLCLLLNVQYLRETLRLTFEEGIQMLKVSKKYNICLFCFVFYVFLKYAWIGSWRWGGSTWGPQHRIRKNTGKTCFRKVRWNSQNYWHTLYFLSSNFALKEVFLTLIIVGMELNSIYYTATLLQFDLSIQCLVPTMRCIATRLMFSSEVMNK